MSGLARECHCGVHVVTPGLLQVAMHDLVVRFAVSAVRAFVFASPIWVAVGGVRTGTGAEYRSKVGPGVGTKIRVASLPVWLCG